MADLNGPAAIVQDKYEKSVALADAASSAVNSFQNALNDSVYAPPTISVQWSSLAAPNLPPIPDLPSLPSVDLVVPDGQPGPLNDTLGNVQIDDFDIEPPKLNFPDAPTIVVGQAPTLPTVRDVAVPDAPDVVLPDVPDFLTLQTHNAPSIDLHEGWLKKLEDIPELSIMQPAPFAYSPGARYASQLLESLKATLNARIHGGTGLNPAVEQAIWGRALDRETALALAKERDVMRGAEALGFQLPSGVMAAQLADARREYHDKLSGLSRDIAIKQAELEQQNVKDAIQAALQLESTLLDDAYKIEALALEAAKTAAASAIAAHNAALEHFKALLAGYQAYASAYDTIIRAELSKVEVFKALLAAEQAKADINKSLADRYRAEIEGALAVVEVYKARVGAAQTLVELERARISAGAEQIKAFVATVNAETSKAELYKATIGAESVKVEAFATMGSVYASKVGAQAEKARVEIAKLNARVTAKAQEWDAWKARLSAATAQVEAASRKSAVMVDGYRAGASAAQAQAGAYMQRWQADIAQYEAGKNIAMQAAKVNADAVMHTNDARMEAAKVGLTTSSQRLASAWAMVSASAQISGQVSQNISG